MKLVVRAAAAAAIAVAALSAAAPAFAATGIAVQVSPSVAKKGATVNVWADCATSGSAEISGQGLDFRLALGPAQRSGVSGPLETANMPFGRYGIVVTCKDGSMGSTWLTVAPNGGARTGDGSTAGGPNSALVTGGATLLGAAAIGGGLLMMRRRSAAQAG
jgi:hypothetical protein